MTVLHIEHAVPNFEGWKKVFDADPIGRKKSGVNKYRIYRSASNPNYVVIDLEFSMLSEAEKTLEALQKLWGRVEGSVMIDPRATILELVETMDL